MLLAINTSLRNVEVALIDTDTHFIIKEKSLNSDRQHTELIFNILDDFLNNGKIIPEEILVVAGPGSFTSIRVGVVIANTICYASNAEIYSIDIRTLFDQENKKTPLFISAGKSEIYEVVNDKKFILNNAENFLKNIAVPFFGVLSDYHLDKLSTKEFLQKRGLSFGNAVVKLLQVGLDKYKVDSAKPIYLKPPNISISKKGY